MSGKYGDIIKSARRSADPIVPDTGGQKTRKPENQETRNRESQKVDASKSDELTAQPDVNLSIKVRRRDRQHWAAEAKRQGTTLTAVIIEALNERFGSPKD